MTCNIALLRGKIVEKGVSQEQLSEKLGISLSTFTRKMKAQGLAFTVGQMHKIVDFLQLTASEAQKIFHPKTCIYASLALLSPQLPMQKVYNAPLSIGITIFMTRLVTKLTASGIQKDCVRTQNIFSRRYSR